MRDVARILRRIQVGSLLVAATALAWALFLVTTGGFDAQILGQRVRSQDPSRPLFIAAFALIVLVVSAGAQARRRWFDTARRVPDSLLVASLAATTLVLGLAYGTTAASGADAYGYVSQADLWLRGDLQVQQPWVKQLPWPSKRWSATPLGYRPLRERGSWAIVPIYSPGLPLMMAFAKRMAGHGAMFWVVPLCGAVMLLATYGIGRSLASSRAGIVGSWLVATSPAFLFELVQPMSDVPAAAAWTVAFYFLLSGTSWGAAASGLAAALAVVIRPNLFWGTAVLGLWFLLRLWRNDGGRRRVVLEAVVFSATAAIGPILVALVNHQLYGSPVQSGYGRFSDNFQASRIGVNFNHYFTWLIETQTPVVLLGIAALVAPTARWWPGARDRRYFLLVIVFVTGLWLMYCSYLVFNVWSFLRFLLPCWPFFMVGIGAVAVWLVRDRGRGAALAVIILVVALGAFQFTIARDRSAFRLWREERRYVSVGRLVQSVTDANSVVLAMQHSGSLRYYGGRMTLRYDILDADWLDEGIEWLLKRGAHPYLLVDEWEIPEFERRFAHEAAVWRVRNRPVFVYEGASRVFLFDLAQARRETPRLFTETYQATRAIPPAGGPHLIFK